MRSKQPRRPQVCRFGFRVSDFKKVRELGGGALMVFIALNELQWHSLEAPYTNPKDVWLKPSKGWLDTFDIDAGRWQRGLTKLENSGFVQTRKKRGQRTLVKLLTDNQKATA